MEAGEFATIKELAEAVGLAERHVSRQLRLAYLAPEVLKRLTCEREALAVSLYDLCFFAGEAWGRAGGASRRKDVISEGKICRHLLPVGLLAPL